MPLHLVGQGLYRCLKFFLVLSAIVLPTVFLAQRPHAFPHMAVRCEKVQVGLSIEYCGEDTYSDRELFKVHVTGRLRVSGVNFPVWARPWTCISSLLSFPFSSCHMSVLYEIKAKRSFLSIIRVKFSLSLCLQICIWLTVWKESKMQILGIQFFGSANKSGWVEGVTPMQLSYVTLHVAASESCSVPYVLPQTHIKH